jgi:hypothetical protein
MTRWREREGERDKGRNDKELEGNRGEGRHECVKMCLRNRD